MTDSSEMIEAAENWQDPPKDLALSDGDVHVWYLHPLQDASHSAQSLLSPDERARAARFKFDRDRDRFVACRSSLRVILARYLKESPAGLQFQYGLHGKPSLIDSDIRFNISHSQDHGLIAIARGREVGVDIECANSGVDPQELAQRFFTPAEAELVRRSPAERRGQLFLKLWTRKEALMKALGCGLHEPLDRFEMLQTLGAMSSQVTDFESGISWTIHELRPDPDVAAAIATAGPIDQLHFWNFVTRATSP